MNDYGIVTYHGKEYRVVEQATLSNRVFPGCFSDAEEGERYISEYVARAVDLRGSEYKVTWQFQEVKFQEQEDESLLPWDNRYITSVIPQ